MDEGVCVVRDILSALRSFILFLLLHLLMHLSPSPSQRLLFTIFMISQREEEEGGAGGGKG